MSRSPPLHLLRSFSRAAATESFSRAAEELSISQSAVSQHIRQLEEMLGTALFERSHRKVTLTEIGKLYLKIVSGAVASLEEGQSMIASLTRSNSLLLKVTRTFGSQWLTPRLPSLAARHPDLSVSLLMLNSLQRMDGHTGDCMIVRASGEGRRTGFRSDLLAKCVLTPVCSPTVAEKVNVTRLDKRRIIHTLIRHMDWQIWCRHAKHPLLPLDCGWTFENSSLAYMAAECGLGIVMAEEFMVRSAILEGKLVRLSPLDVELDWGYFLLTPETGADKPASRLFRDWILDEMRTSAMPQRVSRRKSSSA
jgi:DNA-binding transcriptional LysR family regulator